MSATRGRLLVVDDDLVQRVLISKIGSKLGYDSVVVPSYEAATELLARETFDIMALDLSLGERDGVELLRFVAERDLRAMSIVIISGCDDRIMKATRRVAVGLKLPLAGCLTKPLDLNRLRCALGSARRWSRRRPRRRPGSRRTELRVVSPIASSSLSFSRRSRCGPGELSAPRPSHAGAPPSSAWSRPWSSFRSPSRPASCAR